MSYRKKIKIFFKSRPALKKIAKETRKWIYGVFNWAYPLLKSSTVSQIRQLDRKCQPFILTRHDLGCWLHTLHYANVWRNFRGDVVVFVLSSYWKEIQLITKLLFPDLPMICAGNRYTSLLRYIFGHFCLQTQTLNPIYGAIRSFRLDSIVLFDMPMELEWPSKSPYHYQTDPYLDQRAILPANFIEAYKNFRSYSQHRHDYFVDYGNIVYQDNPHPISDQIRRSLSSLKSQLHFEEPYAILNVNCKEYFDPILDRRSIHFPERFEVVIDELVSKGYHVVLQGREEQPLYKKRKMFVDYARSPRRSLENDTALYSGCSLIVSSKTGPEVFGTIFDKPTIGCNYVEPSGLTPTKKLRYFPKIIRNLKTGKLLTWEEYYFHPSFFNFGKIHFDTNEEHQYLDMTEEELYQSIREFLPLVGQPQEMWDAYSKLQQEFKSSLTRLHLGAFACRGVPLDTYLKR